MPGAGGVYLADSVGHLGQRPGPQQQSQQHLKAPLLHQEDGQRLLGRRALQQRQQQVQHTRHLADPKSPLGRLLPAPRSTPHPSPRSHPRQPPAYLAIIRCRRQKAKHHLHVLGGRAPSQELPHQAEQGSLHCAHVVGR